MFERAQVKREKREKRKIRVATFGGLAHIWFDLLIKRTN
jgi:hypothetical protein